VSGVRRAYEANELHRALRGKRQATVAETIAAGGLHEDGVAAHHVVLVLAIHVV